MYAYMFIYAQYLLYVCIVLVIYLMLCFVMLYMFEDLTMVFPEFGVLMVESVLQRLLTASAKMSILGPRIGLIPLF